jgi:TetR/AcrR family transcriptional repressor of lmrAB and yxaGH operons
MYFDIHTMQVVILIRKCYLWNMGKAPGSREKTIIAAAKLLRRRGYQGTALNDILDAGGAPRGSLYFHFPQGKEEIGEAALTMAGEAVRQAIAGAAQTSATMEVFLVRIARGMAADLMNSGFTEGCPIATTALETADHSDVLGAASRTAFQKWENEIKRGLERFAMTPEDAGAVSIAVLSQLEGALLLARTYRDLEPLNRAEQAIVLLAKNMSASEPKSQFK